MSILAIIPARYASTRFPGKPLANIFGKPMIQHVYERVSETLPAIIATDDQRIFDSAKQFNANVVMTKTTHQSGTDRCAEALQIFEKEQNTQFDVIINVQGDEPFIQNTQIEQLAKLFEQPQTDIGTLVKPIETTEELMNPNKVKVVLGNNNKALYFSRYPIPYVRGCTEEELLKKHTFFKHIGMYGYRRDILLNITQLPKSTLENAESLEQLRWLQNDYNIKVDKTEFEGKCIDTPADLEDILQNGL